MHEEKLMMMDKRNIFLEALVFASQGEEIVYS